MNRVFNFKGKYNLYFVNKNYAAILDSKDKYEDQEINIYDLNNRERVESEIY
jgi:hypothetical protein